MFEMLRRRFVVTVILTDQMSEIVRNEPEQVQEFIQHSLFQCLFCPLL